MTKQGQTVEWNDLNRKDSHPMVYVGLGGHASYPKPGETDWPPIESHRGNGEKFIPKDDQVHYLPRVGNDSAPDWLRYPGHWGVLDLPGGETKIAGISFGGNDGPRGPVFQDFDINFGKESTGRAERWLDPWAFAKDTHDETGGTAYLGGNDSYESIDEVTVNFSVWKDGSRDESGEIDPNKHTYFIIHGYRGTGGNIDNEFEPDEWIADIASAIKSNKSEENSDPNVIIVDWQEGSEAEYRVAVRNSYTIGETIAEYINTQIYDSEEEKYYKYDPKKITLIGHGIGAHIAGDAGAESVSYTHLTLPTKVTV